MKIAENPHDGMISAPSDFAFFLSFFTKKADNNFGIKAIDFAFAFGLIYVSVSSAAQRCLN